MIPTYNTTTNTYYLRAGLFGAFWCRLEIGLELGVAENPFMEVRSAQELPHPTL
jgi:hypothetical protein